LELKGKLNNDLDKAFIEPYPNLLSGSKYVPSKYLYIYLKLNDTIFK
jgi:hypothetical protein